MQHSSESARGSMDNISGLSCRICKEHFPRIYHLIKHCFAGICKLEWMTALDKPNRLLCLTHSILCVIRAHAQICENKIFKIAISEHLDPQKFTAIWYTVSLVPSPRLLTPSVCVHVNSTIIVNTNKKVKQGRPRVSSKTWNGNWVK